MKATKKILCLFLALALTLCSLPLVAFAAGEGAEKVQATKQITFAANRLLTLHEPITKTPNTFHAVISLPENASNGGVIFGNYRSEDYGFFSLEVNANGNPSLRFTNEANEAVNATFDAVDLRLGTSLALTVVRTDVNAYCYVNGTLMQKLEGNFAYGDVMTAPDVWNRYGSLYEDPNDQEFILGGDNVKNNPNYFKGSLSSLVLYTEALSAAGVEKAIAGTCEFSPILSYVIGEGDSEYCVRDRSGNGLNASTTFYERPYELPEYEYAFAIVGDTQVQVETDLKDGTSYTANIYDYIVNNKESKKIGYVFGVGDITQTNIPEEWAIAKNAVTKLDAAGIGYSLVAGDHDNNANYYTYHENFNNTFRETLTPRIAGFYDETAGLTNYYMTFKVGTEKYAVLCLEVGPRTDVIAWANSVIEQHPDRKFIITTHSWVAKNGTTTDPGDSGAKNEAGSMGANSPSNGDRLWDELASLHENVFMVFSGHIAYENVVMRQDRGVHGNTVTSFLVNHQSMSASYSMVCMLYISADGTARTEWISTTKSMEAGNDVFYKTQSSMSFNTNGLDDEGTLIAESRFDGGTNSIKATVNGSVAQMSTDNGIYKLYFEGSKATTYASFTKRVDFNASYAYKYLTYEFDISTESKLFEQLNIFFVPRNASGGKNNTRFYFVQKNGTYYLSNKSDGTGDLYPLGISHANEWAHITVVFDTENMIGGTGDSAECVAHFFINGKYAMTNETPFQTGATYFNEMRLWTSSSLSTLTDTLCVDNLVLKGFRPEESEGIDNVLAQKWLSLSSVKGIDYKEDYVFPNGAPLAKVTSNDVDTYYYNEFDLGESVKEGDTVTMLRDAYTPVSFANTVTVSNENEYKLVFDVAKNFSITTSDGTTTFYTTDEFFDAVKAIPAEEGATIEQYTNVTLSTHKTFYPNGAGSSSNAAKVWNMNGYTLNATAQTDHFIKCTYYKNGSGYVANMVVNNGTINTNKTTLFSINPNDCLEFNNIRFIGSSTFTTRDGKIKLNGCTFRTSANTFLTAQGAAINNNAYVYYRNCDFTMLNTSPRGLMLSYTGSNGNDFNITFENCNIKRYSEQSSMALITTQGTAGATLTNFSPTVNFIGTEVYSRIFAFHNFGELTINVTDGSRLDIDHTSIDKVASWTGSTYLGNATEPQADRYKLTINVEDGCHLSNKVLVDNTAGNMKAENLVVNLGGTNSYAKEIGDPNTPYIVGAPDFTVKSSLTLYTDFDYNFIIPVDAGVDTFKVGDVILTPVDVYPIGEEYYHRYTFEGIYVSEFAKEHTVSLVSDAFDLSLTVSLLSYAQKVLSDETNADAHQMMIDMLAYAKEAQAYLPDGDAELIAELEALIAAHGEVSTYEPVETTTKVPRAVAEYINGVWISLGNTPVFKFSVIKDGVITLSYVDADGNTQSHSYNAKAGESIRLDMHLFDFASEITISVDGVDEVGTYDLYTYINRTENDTNAENDTCLPLVKALYSYVQSARAYKESV